MASSSSPSITLKGCYTVTPMEPTWNGCLPLTQFDKLGITTYVPLLLFYLPPQNWLTKIATTLKHSLSRVLVHFYPFAGRFRSKGNNTSFDLECNAKGVHFIEAESSDVGNFSPSSHNYYHYLLPHLDYTLPIQDRPLLIVQLTNFKCGHISISLLISHAVVDGQSLTHFLNEWAHLARGEPLNRVPFLDRNILHNKKPCKGTVTVKECKFDEPPVLLENSDNSNVEERKKKTTVAIMEVNKAQVERLRKIANERWNNKPNNERNYTMYETISGHIWRSACKARGHKNDQPTVFGVIVDWRTRVKPSLPKEYFGNATVNVRATSLAGDLMSKPLGYASSKIKEAIEKVNDEYVRLMMSKYIKRKYDWTMVQNLVPVYGNPNLAAVSWVVFSFHKIDFGWGKAVYVMPGIIGNILEGEAYILPNSRVDGSLLIFICLQEVYMDAFKRYFYEGVELDSLSKL